MEDFILQHESIINTVELSALILLVGLWEAFGKSREYSVSALYRWLNNFSLLIIDNIVARVVVPVAAIGAALAAVEMGWGVFNNIDLPVWLIFLLTIAILDINNYFQHWLMHRISALWRVHQIHHTDIDVDWSTAFRFHPGESIFTLGLQTVVILAIGASPAAVAIYEVVFVVSAFFVHTNVVMPPRLERRIRALVITPDMHRIHHSIDIHEGNSNFGGILSWWDRIFGTYCAHPQLNQIDMLLGLAEYRDGKEQNLWWLFKLPFVQAKQSTQREFDITSN